MLALRWGSADLADRRPHWDDDLPHGVRFYRTSPDFASDVKEHDIENLTPPRTFFGPCETFSYISFRNTDLSESTHCANDFIEVDFTDADLSAGDLRCSIYTRTSFVRTDLRNADLRRCTFEECDFTDADLRGAKLTHEEGKLLPLSDEQKRQIDWQESKGDWPDCGY
jgi:BTB/POZ domain-containing protein KCTD9